MKIGRDIFSGKLAGLVQWRGPDQGRGILRQANDERRGGFVQRQNRAAGASLDPTGEIFGAGGGWANPEYGAYYATSVSVYAAVKLRADAISRRAHAGLSPRPRRNKIAGGSKPSRPATSGQSQPLVYPVATFGRPPKFTLTCGGRPSGPWSGTSRDVGRSGPCAPTA